MKGGAGGGGEERALQAKHYYIFVGGGGSVCVFFFNPVGSWLFCGMYNFLQATVLLKNAVCSNGFCWNEKKFLFLEEGSPEKKKWVMWVPWYWYWLVSWPYGWWFSREVKSQRIHYYIPVKPSYNPGYFSRKLKPRHIFGTAGTHRRLNPGT